MTAVIIGVLTAWLSPGGLFSKPQEPNSPPSTASSDVPFTVATSVLGSCGGGEWIVDKEPGTFEEPPATHEDDDWRSWAQKVGAVRSGEVQVTFTVQGKSSAQVVLTNLEVAVVKREKPSRGTLVYDVCGGVGKFRWAEANLDSDPPNISTHYETDSPFEGPGDIPPQELRPMKFPYTVAISDAENFEVDGVSSLCDCTWEIRLHWTSEGKRGVYVVNDNGNPFRTVGSKEVSANCSVGWQGYKCK